MRGATWGGLAVGVAAVVLGLTATIAGVGPASVGGALASIGPRPAPDGPAASVPARGGTERLAWLAGGWILERGGDLLEENWSAPRRGTMVGWFRWLTPDGLRLTELVTITDEEDGTVFRLRHFSPEMVPWEAPDSAFTYPLSSVDGRRVVFSNPERDHPRSFVYERTTGDSLVVHVIGGGEARGDTMVFRYSRTGG